MTLDTVLAELSSALAYITPRIAGLENYLKLGGAPDTLDDATLTAVDRLRIARTQRRDAIVNAITALEHLKGNGYPDLPAATVEEVVYEDLRQEFNEVSLALQEFTVDRSAANLNLSVSEPEPK